MGMTKFIMGNVFPAPSCGSTDDRPGFAKMHFMYYAMVIFGVSGVVMVVVSFFTKKIPREELGGLTWSTINEPPISHGAIGEEGFAERIAENGNVHNAETFELLKNTGKAEIAYESPETNNVAEKQNQPDSLVSSDKVLLTVVKFAEEDPILKWFLRVMSIMLLITLAFLWLFYR